MNKEHPAAPPPSVSEDLGVNLGNIEKELFDQSGKALSETMVEWVTSISSQVIAQLIREDPGRVAYALRWYFRQAAALLIILGQRSATQILSTLPESDKVVLLRNIASLPNMDLEDQMHALRQFALCFSKAATAGGTEGLTIDRINELLPTYPYAGSEAFKVYFKKLAVVIRLLDKDAETVLGQLNGLELEICKRFLQENERITDKERYEILRDFIQMSVLPTNAALMAKPELAATLAKELSIEF